ncbi:MAG: DUF4469 domain-containing protein [Spirochaetaceae bacterium]|nr:DUF4469 domain-containing protein [Spirochaetaceae bacterium]
MLKYALRENLLTPEPDDYMAQTVDARSYSGEEIVELMLKRGSTLTKADAAAGNKPARLMVMIPATVAAGTYHVEVRTKLDSSGKPGKSLKVGRFGKELTVAGAGA